MPKVVTFKEEPDIFDQIRKEQSDTQRSRYFDYLMQGESRRQSRMEEAKEDSRESFRLNLKKSAIAENTGNKTYEAMYRAELSKRSGITNSNYLVEDPGNTGLQPRQILTEDEYLRAISQFGENSFQVSNQRGYGSLDVTIRRIDQLTGGMPIPEYLDSATIKSLTNVFSKRALAEGVDEEEKAIKELQLNQLLNGLVNIKKSLANSNTTLKGIPGALVADDGSPRGFRPMRNMFDYYASEFGEDPFTTKKINPNQIPPKPSDQDIKESADQLEGVAGALEDEGVLDNVNSDSPISDDYLKGISDWITEGFEAVSGSDINEDGSVTQEAYPGALSSVDQDAEAGDPEYITPLPSDAWRYDTSGTIDPPAGIVTSEDLSEEDLPVIDLTDQAPSLMGRPLQPMYSQQIMTPQSLPTINYSDGPEINEDGETMQTVYPESLLKLSEGTEGYDMGGGEPELSGSIPMEGSPVISSPMDEEELRLQELGIQADLQRDQIEKETNEGLMQLEEDHQRKLRTFMNQKNMQYSDMESIRDFAGKAALGLGSFLGTGGTSALAWGARGVASKGKGLWNFLRTLGKAKPKSKPLAVPPGARGRGFPSTPKPDPALAIPPGARGRGFPAQPPFSLSNKSLYDVVGKPDINNLAIPPSLRGRGFQKP